MRPLKGRIKVHGASLSEYAPDVAVHEGADLRSRGISPELEADGGVPEQARTLEHQLGGTIARLRGAQGF